MAKKKAITVRLKDGRKEPFRRSVRNDKGETLETLVFEYGVEYPLTDAQAKAVAFDLETGMLVQVATTEVTTEPSNPPAGE